MTFLFDQHETRHAFFPSLFPGTLGEWLASPWRRPNRSSRPAALGSARRRSSTKTSTWPSTTQVGTSPAVTEAGYTPQRPKYRSHVLQASEFSTPKLQHVSSSSACKNVPKPLPSTMMLVGCQIYYRTQLRRKKVLFGNSRLRNRKNPVQEVLP